MKKQLLLLLLIAFPFVLHANLHGQRRIDSLVQRLSEAKDDTGKVKILNGIAYGLAFINPEEGISYGIRGLKLSEELKWKRGIALLDNTLGYACQAKSDFQLAIKYGLAALAIDEEIGDKMGTAAALGNIAGCYLAQTNYPLALEYYFRTLKIAEELNDKPTIALTLLGIGIVYDENKGYNKAMDYYSVALRKFEELRDKRNIATCLSNIGQTYQHQHQYGLAVDNNLKALKIFEELGDKYGVMVSEGIAGEAYLLEGDYPRALEFYFKALKLSREVGSKEYIAAHICSIGEIYLEIAKDSSRKIMPDSFIPAGRLANLDKAIEYLRKGVETSAEINTLSMLIKYQCLLSEAYRLNGDYGNALKHYEAYSKIKDSVFSTDNKIKIANLATERETSLKEKQIEINKLAETKKRNERSMFMAGFGLLSVVILVVVRNYNTQKNASREKGELLRQKDVLMKEIHHRVKNNLQVISALLDLQLNSITDEHAIEAMTESTSRVRSISLIHQQLYQNENITEIEFSRFAKDLLFQITSVFRKLGQTVVMRKEMPETILDIDTAVPLGLILNELMTNSFKYAFAGTADGTLEITLHHKKNDYILKYCDSGPGLPDNFDMLSSKSMGMKVMHSLSKQIGGRFSYEPETKNFVVVFKNITARKLID
jgi:two-component system, sensor histidine kinase PdtaS